LGIRNQILKKKKKKGYRQTDGEQPGYSQKHAVVKRPKREAHFSPQFSVDG
jgi:hypothetical protein